MRNVRSHGAVTSYLRAQARGRHGAMVPDRAPDSPPFPFLTISRQAGAGSLPVAEAVAEILNESIEEDGGPPWTVFDRNLIDLVAAAHDLPPSVVRFLEEEDRLLDHAGFVEDMFAFHPSVSSLVHKTSRTILKLAGLGRAILVGRGAALVTRDLPGGYHVRLVGSPARRTEYLMDVFGLDADAARDRREREDRARARYVKRYFRRDVEDPLLYHLVIDTDLVPRAEAAATIAAALRTHAGARTVAT